LRQQPFSQSEFNIKRRLKLRTKFPRNIPNHPIQISLQSLYLPTDSAHLPSMSIPASLQQSLGTKALADLTKADPLH